METLDSPATLFSMTLWFLILPALRRTTPISPKCESLSRSMTTPLGTWQRMWTTIGLSDFPLVMVGMLVIGSGRVCITLGYKMRLEKDPSPARLHGLGQGHWLRRMTPLSQCPVLRTSGIRPSLTFTQCSNPWKMSRCLTISYLSSIVGSWFM